MTKRLKILIAVLIVIVLVSLVIWYFSRPSQDAGKSVVSVGGAEVTQESQLSQANDILGILSLLKTINLDLNFFNNPAFNSLYDFSVKLPVPDMGKSNPFAL